MLHGYTIGENQPPIIETTFDQTSLDIENCISANHQQEVKLLQQVVQLRIERERLLKKLEFRNSDGGKSVKRKFLKWTPERIALLKEMVQANIPSTEIAEFLNVSKTAVVGKAKQKGLCSQKPIVVKAVDEVKPIPKSGLVKNPRKKQVAASPPTLTTDGDIQSTDEYTCPVVDVPEILIPDRFIEAITYLKSVFTTKHQWSYLHAYIGFHEL